MASDRTAELPAWPSEADIRELRRAAVLSVVFDCPDDLATLIEDARRLLTFLLAAPSRGAADSRLGIFNRTPGRCWHRRIALASALCRYTEEGVAA